MIRFILLGPIALKRDEKKSARKSRIETWIIMLRYGS